MDQWILDAYHNEQKKEILKTCFRKHNTPNNATSKGACWVTPRPAGSLENRGLSAGEVWLRPTCHDGKHNPKRIAMQLQCMPLANAIYAIHEST